MSLINVDSMADSQGGVLAPISSVMRNRIINGAMTIDQRNAGASVTLNDSGIYTVDRWQGYEDSDGVMTAQQDSAAPAGFVNSLKLTTTTADTSLSAGQLVQLTQRIEGFNVADLGWGTANAKTITLSFWVRSSLTGAFGGAIQNSANNRSYPFTYSISAANTFEYKTITIEGDTSGTWLTTNGTGLQIRFSMGAGSDFQGTAGAWAGSDRRTVTGATSVVGTNGATFYITGVQLEKGAQATSFEYRQFGQELALCQRYFYTIGGNNSFETFATGVIQAAANAEFILNMPVTMRALPTASIGGTAGNFIVNNNSSFTPSAVSFDIYALNTLRVSTNISGATAGNGAYLRANNTLSAKINVTAEL